MGLKPQQQVPYVAALMVGRKPYKGKLKRKLNTQSQRLKFEGYDGLTAGNARNAKAFVRVPKTCKRKKGS
jgi:hypothetical protein